VLWIHELIDAVHFVHRHPTMVGTCQVQIQRLPIGQGVAVFFRGSNKLPLRTAGSAALEPAYLLVF
jgi:hypothetical protein